MSDENSSIVEEEQQQEPPKMAETEQHHDDLKTAENAAKSFSIWPPSQRTRDAVMNRLIETLSTPSVLSKRYGSIPADEAAAAARRIEDEAFATAAACSLADDIEILQIYSKDISKRMLEVVKSRSAAADSSGTVDPTTATTVSEETSSVES